MTQEKTIEFEVLSYDEQCDTFKLGQTNDSRLLDFYLLEPFEVPAPVLASLLNFTGEPFDFIGYKVNFPEA